MSQVTPSLPRRGEDEKSHFLIGREERPTYQKIGNMPAKVGSLRRRMARLRV